MDCKQTQILLGAYADGELDARGSLEIEEHLRNCTQCVKSLEGVKQIQLTVKSNAATYRAPDALRRKLAPEAAVPGPPQFAFAWPTAVGLAACVLAALVIGFQFGRIREPSDFRSAFIDGHVRALMADHLADVISTDKHTVKPWFNGKLDYAPPVIDLMSQGYPLKGGRLDFMDNRRVAVLVYGRNKHVIDLYIRPIIGGVPFSDTSKNGFNVAHWSNNDFEYVAVSDLNAQELDQFCKLIDSSQ